MKKSKLNREDEYKKGHDEVNVDEAINEAFYSEKQKNDSTPTSYLNNNTAAIDVTGNKDEDR
ncbi:hypothetical protein [Alkalihalobacillus sp. CinArs1]|uniref:hypothetical protein n=1 Tax=Alkalihalobacillus sp. CinArs1 TaxID=2995314 RepID=UPI0022DDEA25|nr:hypothetical protein [Alkalihalobacillus sp. CinArs1]